MSIVKSQRGLTAGIAELTHVLNLNPLETNPSAIAAARLNADICVNGVNLIIYRLRPQDELSVIHNAHTTVPEQQIISAAHYAGKMVVMNRLELPVLSPEKTIFGSVLDAMNLPHRRDQPLSPVQSRDATFRVYLRGDPKALLEGCSLYKLNTPEQSTNLGRMHISSTLILANLGLVPSPRDAPRTHDRGFHVGVPRDRLLITADEN